MVDQPTAPPPELPGLRPIRRIGSGGYADVHLYQQERPNREVAVKVLARRGNAGGVDPGQFAAEADLMARVSTHPYIVEIYQVGVAADGRPYLVMQYYPGLNLAQRARRDRMAVAEVLRTGIHLASAVETAHRAGIFHRDIKPANVLTDDYNRPGLTDFGIATAAGPDGVVDAVSIPWAPPEALGEAAPTPQIDVYSLAATIYNLLAGRSPFEVSGGDNGQLALIGRIERQPVPRIERNDVPPSLHMFLNTALAKDPGHRPATAAAFGRQLQAIESELRLSVTPLDLAGETPPSRTRTEAVDDDEATAVKGITEIEAQSEGLIRSVGVAPAAARTERRREGLLAEPEVADTQLRPEAAEPTPMPDLERPGLDRRNVLAAAAGLAVALVATVGFLLTSGVDGNDATDEDDLEQFEVNDNLDADPVAGPTPVTDLVGVARDGGLFRFTWSSAGAGHRYAVTEDGSTVPESVEATIYDATTSCIEVEVIAPDGQVSPPTRGCT